jgi:hypothetical protein
MSHGGFFRRIAELKSVYASMPELPFSVLLTAERIESLVNELGVLYRDRIYLPSVTLWVFLSQVLSQDHSCRDAVARFLAFRTACALPACSTNTGSYCEARQRLPEELLKRLTVQTGQELHEQAPTAWCLHGRRVKLVDGATVSMPDSDANAVFGKAQNQYGLVGFPIARIMILLCLATGAVLASAIGPYRGKQTGELALFRGLLDALVNGDILLGDRIFGTFCEIAGLAHRGVDVVFRWRANRPLDFRRGLRLGHDDHLVNWRKPTACPEGFDESEFAALPAELTGRELRVRVTTPGFRVKWLVVVTTLLDPLQFSAEDIANLYRQRWQAELDLRSIKAVMQMDVLRCQTPDMVRKEIWVHLLAYNLLRSVMCAAAHQHGVPVREISFKGTLQLLNAFHHSLITSTPQALPSLCDDLLSAVCTHRDGQRPNRYEPRKRKRSPKPYPAMKKPRHQERKLCLQQH